MIVRLLAEASEYRRRADPRRGSVIRHLPRASVRQQGEGKNFHSRLRDHMRNSCEQVSVLGLCYHSANVCIAVIA